MISDTTLWEPKGRLDLSCTRCLPLDKPFTWKKLESGSGKTFSILDTSLADLISTSRFVFISSCCFPSTWHVNMVVSGCSKTKKSTPWISS